LQSSNSGAGRFLGQKVFLLEILKPNPILITEFLPINFLGKYLGGK
jgi:hypothetical protein